MIRKRHVPYIFLLILILFLIFIAGVKYGGKVEEANKTIRYVLSITPTKNPTIIPTISPTDIPVGYKLVADENCDISFILPDNLNLKTDLSGIGPNEWENSSKKTQILYWCYSYGDIPEGGLITQIPTLTPKKSFETFHDVTATNSSIIKLDSKEIKIYKKTTPENVILKFIHPGNGKFIGFTVSQKIYPLVEQSLKFNIKTPKSTL